MTNAERDIGQEILEGIREIERGDRGRVITSKIRLLPDRLVSQIAAGEVVERPASVVKELVENALDAGAGEVRVELEGGGKRRIAVADDGSGMGRDDALLAFDRHATSKIASFDDLQRVGTLGFRGEALAAIAAVARVELATAETPGEGQRVRIEGGRVLSAEPAPRPRGTTVEVASLFFNVPARRKFLKAPATELRRAVEAVQGYALARPEVRFTVRHEGRALLDALAAAGGEAAGAAALRERIAQVFGRDLAAGLVAIPDEESTAGAPERADGGDAAARPTERIHGFVGTPAGGRSRRQFVFVNRRLVRDRLVLAAFYRAVREEWKSEDFPALFLFLDLPPEEVDVNVHPQKAEVRFRDPRLLDRVHARLRRALGDARGEEPAPLKTPAGAPRAPLAWQGLGARKAPPGEDAAGEWEVRGAGDVAEPPSPPWGEPGAAGTDPAARRLATPSLTPLARAPVPLSGRRGEPRPFRLLGQYKGTLILLEGPDGLYLIDQHVAHERLLYERLRRAMARERTPSQRLLAPPVLELSAAEHLRLSELAPALAECGFELAPLSGGSLAVAAIPAALDAGAAEDLLRTLAAADPEAGEADGGGEVAGLRRRVLEALAASRACKAAVKMHHPLSAVEMEALVAELFLCETPYACPHGRPVVLQMTDADLERRFGRR
jgi:DNA mismatch repair protein MutL